MLSVYPMEASVPALLRLGVFELNTRSGELRRQGWKIRLQNQPFQVLLRLIDQPGDIVTRAELRTELWSGNTFVNFDRGLNKAISSLRTALRDSARKPQYIQTLPQRGYRFIAPVEKVIAEPSNGVLSGQDRRIDSLAVLPLDNLSGDSEQEYFSEGLTAELISAVAKIAGLRVISRTSVMTYKGSRKPLPQIARELRVDALVEGSVARSEGKVRVTAQLIYAATDSHLWSGKYERDLRDVLELQAEITRSIAHHIERFVDSNDNPKRQVNPAAYEAYLKGDYFRDKMTPLDLEKSVVLFQNAINLDPNYAQAHAALSRSYFFLGLFGVERPDNAFPKAKASAIRALTLDETVAAAYNALAAGHVFEQWDWAGAESEAKRAVELSPGDSATHAHSADYISIQGRHDEAIEKFRRALELDPISRVFIAHFGLILYRARRYEESIAQCRKALEIAPDYPNALWFLALSLEQTGELAKTVEVLENAVRISRGPHYRALLARAYGLAGEKEKALRIVDELDELSVQRYVSPFDRAIAYAGLSNRDLLFQLLEEAYQQKVFRLVELVSPMFDTLRSDQRWQVLVRRIGLPG